ncbi:hypothetical protein ACFPJ4_01895 [Lysinimonas soli]|uniref:Glutaminase n=1 Tax=Lysinimonas soli TaxID=1074233 RepID=A0ABW0NK66_9MICO
MRDSASAAAIDSAIARLTAASARTEILAELHPPRKFGPFRRAPRMTRLGSVWRLGVLLLAPDGRLYATGQVIRAADPRHPNFTSASGEVRREIREAARAAGLPPGETVDFDAAPIELDADTPGGPVVRVGDELRVSWNGSRSLDSLVPFGRYLTERVELLADPPEGA